MFTGIIEAVVPVLEAKKNVLVLPRPESFDDIKVGSSIAVLGTCLSVVAFDDASMSFDVVPTTLQKTKLGTLKAGDSVNVERALRADGRLEGHIVLGHIEGTGKVLSLQNAMLQISIPVQLLGYVVHHGSITIDGVALTVASLDADKVTVALIPHTLENTTLGSLKAGDTVNLETDVVGKYILRAHVTK